FGRLIYIYINYVYVLKNNLKCYILKKFFLLMWTLYGASKGPFY
ncbi:unnamed protein product, partial [Brassica rapa subsp. narinosa]